MVPVRIVSDSDGRILPAARELAADLNQEWPSEVYEKIVAVIERQLKSVSSASRV